MIVSKADSERKMIRVRIAGPIILCYIPSVILVKKLRFYKIGKVDDGFIVFSQCVAGLGGKKRNAVVDAIVKG